MHYQVLAVDYDGTIATHGSVDNDTLRALRRLKASGRRLLLVTGRELDDLRRVFAQVSLFDLLVVENGAVLYDPSIQETAVLCTPPPRGFVAELERRGVTGLSVGHAIVAMHEQYAQVVLAAIHDLALNLQIIFNRDAVMVLPSGVNKATGLLAALARLGVSPHNTVGVGDAENDDPLLAVCGCGVAVANALPALKARADLVTHGERGAGVAEVVERLIASDLAEVAPALRTA